MLGEPSGAMPQKSKILRPLAAASRISWMVRMPVAWSFLPSSDWAPCKLYLVVLSSKTRPAATTSLSYLIRYNVANGCFSSVCK